MQTILKTNDKPGGTPDLMTGTVRVGHNRRGIYLTNYDASRYANLLTHIKRNIGMVNLSFIEVAELDELICLLSKVSV